MMNNPISSNRKNGKISVYILGAILGGVGTFYFENKSADAMQWLSYVKIVYGAFWGALLLESLVFMKHEIQRSAAQRSLFYVGIGLSLLLTAPFLVMGWPWWRILAWGVLIAWWISWSLLAVRQKDKVSLKSIFWSLLLGGVVALLLAAFLGVTFQNYENVVQVIVGGFIIGVLFSRTTDFFWG